MAVYDLGGGTFDATVLRKHPGGVEILGTPEGIERLGGVDFDQAILSYVDYSAGGMLSELDMGDPQTIVALARLRQDCILAKEALSVDLEATIPVFLPGRNFDVQLTRSGFEDLIRVPIESTIGALSRALQSAQVDPTELTAVLLVGGSSRIPLVARMVSAELGCACVVDTHPKYAVALGAAALAIETAPAPVPTSASSDSSASRTTPAAVRPEAAVPVLTATVQAGPTPGYVAISPNGRQAYVANRDAKVITVVDTATNRVTATIPIPAGPPQFLAFSPDGGKLYVSVFNDRRTGSAITVVDTATKR